MNEILDAFDDTMRAMNEVLDALEEAQYAYALGIATEAEIQAGAACGMLALVVESSK
jgi:hypothetical protein